MYEACSDVAGRHSWPSSKQRELDDEGAGAARFTLRLYIRFVLDQDALGRQASRRELLTAAPSSASLGSSNGPLQGSVFHQT